MPPLGYSKFGEEEQELYLNSLRSGNLKHASARKAGVSYRTILRYKQVNEDFATQERMAMGEALEEVEKVLHDMALEGDIGAIKMWLQAHGRSTYNDKKVVELDATPAAVEASKAEALARVADLQKTLAERHADLQQIGSGDIIDAEIVDD